MLITAEIKKKIKTIVGVFETSSLKPRYDILVVMADGPGRIKQITYGSHQTTEFGNLKTLIAAYVAEPLVRYRNDFAPYLSKIGKTQLHEDTRFKQLLKLAGTDPVMHKVQDLFFDQHYWNPAMKFATENGFTLPLSMLVLFDSYIQSGSILDFLRQRFSEQTPINKGNEQKWITDYTSTRDKWLEGHSNPLLPQSDYRTDCLLEQIAAGNWHLECPVVCKFNSRNFRNWITIQ